MSAPQPKRIIVTGGRGRLAALVADHFRAPTNEVSLFSRRAGDGFLPLHELPAHSCLAEADVVLHLAWSTLPATSETAGGIEQTTDLPYLEKLLAALAALPATRRPHFIFSSSGGAVYGEAPGRPNREDDPCRPVGAYGRAKRAAEETIQSHAARSGLPCAILRISNPYGYPVPRNRMQGLIPHALRCAVDGLPLTLWGDGTAQKDFIYYTDFLSALECAINQRLVGTYNLAVGVSHTVTEVVQLIEAQAGKPISMQRTPAPAWDVHDSRLDPARFIAATGWRPQVGLEEGIRRFAAGYALS